MTIMPAQQAHVFEPVRKRDVIRFELRSVKALLALRILKKHVNGAARIWGTMYAVECSSALSYSCVTRRFCQVARQSVAESAARYTTPALEKGLDILELFASTSEELSKREVARRLGRTVSEIFRMLVCLEQRGYLAQSPE